MTISFASALRLLTLTGLTLASACSSKKNDQPATEPQQLTAAPATAPRADSTTAATPPAPDSTGLSPKFLRGLRELTGSAAYQVRGKWLVLGEQDSVEFPTGLPAGRAVTYAGQQQNQAVSLTVTRLNYTSLKFAADLAGGQHAEGVADLNPGFYLGVEVPEETETQTAFPAAEFIGETAQGNFSIQIGLGADADKASLFVYDATGKPLPKWQGLPTLRRKAAPALARTR